MTDPRHGFTDPNAPEEWIVCDGERFKELRKEKRFCQLVALSRQMNSYRFAWGALLSTMGQTTPESMRQRVNCTFFLGALLFEGMSLVRRMSATFRDDVHYEKWMRPLLQNAEMQEFINTRLKPLRNWAVFHADDDYLEEQLARIHNKTIVFQSFQGANNGTYWNELADMVAMQVMMGQTPPGPGFQDKLQALTNQTLDYAAEFEHACNTFGAYQLLDLGFSRVPARPGEGFHGG